MADEPEVMAVEATAEGSILTASGDPPLPIDASAAESESDATSPLSATHASVSAADWTIETIVSQMRKGRLDLNPKFQRRAAWTDATKSRFIESAILNYPIPQVVLAERLDRAGHFFVIDGKQRLLALRQFYAGAGERADHDFDPLHLTGLSILKDDLKGFDIRDLERKRGELFDAFENHTIRTVVVRNWQYEDFLYTLFLRLNTGSVPLSPQELRQALVPGPFVDFVDFESGQSPGLRRILGNHGPDRRMIDAEMMVRFLGFYLSPVEYRGNLKLFLDGTCKALNERWDTAESDIRAGVAGMELAIDAAMRIFGPEHASHKWSGRWERSFNRAVFDVQIGALVDDDVREKSIAAGEALRGRFMSLCVDDSNFSRAISTTTKSLEATRERFTKWFSVVNDVTGSEIEPPACLVLAAA